MIIKVKNLTSGLTARNKKLNGKKRHSCYSSDGTYAFDCGVDYTVNTQSVLFTNFLRCYALRNKCGLNTLIPKHDTYWSPYINAETCRDMVKYFREANKEKRIYMIPKEFGVKYEYWCRSDAWKHDHTMVIRQKKMSEKEMFIKALCDDGIRYIDNKEKHFFFRVMKFMENSQGVWL